MVHFYTLHIYIGQPLSSGKMANEKKLNIFGLSLDLSRINF